VFFTSANHGEPAWSVQGRLSLFSRMGWSIARNRCRHADVIPDAHAPVGGVGFQSTQEMADQTPLAEKISSARPFLLPALTN